MSLYSYFRISKPSKEKVPAEQVDEEYKRLRTRTFWGVTAAYTMYYVCRMTLGVVKQPIIDGGVLTAGELGVIGSVFYFVYADEEHCAIWKANDGWTGDAYWQQ